MDNKELIAAGAKLANTAFNLAQQAGLVLTPEVCAGLSKCQKEWDEAVSRAPAPQAAIPTEGVPFPPLEFPVMTHDKLGPLWDRLGMQMYALKYSDLVRAATSPAPAVVQMTDEQIIDICAKNLPTMYHETTDDWLVEFAHLILSASGVRHE
jgi:hypothetical protein